MYLTGPGSAVAYPTGMLVLTIRGDEVSAITRFLDQRLPGTFGLPALVP
jgi:RNA polymerase sigma-70 factor (ECF subfamily)